MHAQDLVEYICGTAEFLGHFSIGVAGTFLFTFTSTVPKIITGYPDGHPDKDVSEEEELVYLKRKVDAGADFILTQLFYDVDGFLSWVSRVRSKGQQIPCITGLLFHGF